MPHLYDPCQNKEPPRFSPNNFRIHRLYIVELLFHSILTNVMANLTTAVNYRTAIAEIKRQYDLGVINREKAKELAQPILNSINTRAAEISRRHGKKAYKVDFVSAMRNSY